MLTWFVVGVFVSLKFQRMLTQFVVGVSGFLKFQRMLTQFGLLVLSLSGKLMLLASSLPSSSGSCPISLLRSALPLLAVSKDSMTLNAASIVVCLLEVLLALPLTLLVALPLTLLVALLVALPLTLLVALLVALPLTLPNLDGSLIERMVLETRVPCLVGKWSSNACGP